ncbi:MAG: phosphatidylglycerophosphatase A [Acidobacteria bacterium]|nr:phosphatidylglycerophosphatase A [Acidobacteriota bacterium]
MTRLAVLIATAGGAGFVPVAPGTAGSAVGIALYWFTRHWSAPAQVTLVIVVCAAGVWAASRAALHFRRKDPGQVVIDEVAGQLVTVLLLGVGAAGAILGFLVFRLFDIVKPWPVRRLEALPGGWGIMADDLAAGALGWVLLRGVSYLALGVA